METISWLNEFNTKNFELTDNEIMLCYKNTLSLLVRK